jgi:hypothetical protein
LLGKTIQTLPVSDREAATIHLRRDAGGVPPLIQATVKGTEDRTPLQFVIAVDERIVALTKSYKADGIMRFSALLPPKTWSRPWDKLQIFVARHRDADVALQPVESME